jgi:hypothetical protein
MKPVKIIFVIMLITVFSAASSEAGWLIYHKPEFKGKVVDAETKLPIEGAVVVVVYNKTTMGLGAGTISSIINVRETLTDKDGMFRIPSYTTLIQPFSWPSSASFIIFKPSYGNFPDQRIYPPGLSLPDQEIFFSAGIGAERYLETQVGLELKFSTLKTGIVELPKLKTREDRLKSIPSPIGEESDYKKQKLFIRMLNEENKNLGLKGQYKIK